MYLIADCIITFLLRSVIKFWEITFPDYFSPAIDEHIVHIGFPSVIMDALPVPADVQNLDIRTIRTAYILGSFPEEFIGADITCESFDVHNAVAIFDSKEIVSAIHCFTFLLSRSAGLSP